MRSNYHGPIPYAYFSHDKDWICEQLEKMPPSLRKQIAEKYAFNYQMAIERNEGKIEAETLARRACNTRLRKLVELYSNGGLAQTYSPEGVYKEGLRA